MEHLDTDPEDTETGRLNEYFLLLILSEKEFIDKSNRKVLLI